MKRTQKQSIEILKETVDAVFFQLIPFTLKWERKLTYSGIDRLTAIQELEKYQKWNYTKQTIMLVFRKGILPVSETSWEYNDYLKYLKKQNECSKDSKQEMVVKA